jgi:6-phosphogluconolactonase (cycloisomerase 2 family)
MTFPPPSRHQANTSTSSPSSSTLSSSSRSLSPKATALDPNGVKTAPNEVPNEFLPEMTSGEIVLHPTNDRVLYVSNRGQVDLNSKTGGNAKGDAIAIITLNEEGDKFDNVEIVPTEINFIRGMQITQDGKYLGVVGQKDGKAAVYQTGGQYGESIELVASVDAGLDVPTDVTWV